VVIKIATQKAWLRAQSEMDQSIERDRYYMCNFLVVSLYANEHVAISHVLCILNIVSGPCYGW